MNNTLKYQFKHAIRVVAPEMFHLSFMVCLIKKNNIKDKFYTFLWKLNF